MGSIMDINEASGSLKSDVAIDRIDVGKKLKTLEEKPAWEEENLP